MQTFTVKDFSGGMDDNFLSAPPNTAYLLSNFWIDVNAKPRLRPGTSVFPTRATTSASSSIFYGMYLGERPFGRPIFLRKDKAFYLDENDVFQEILGPELNVALPNKPTNTPEAVQFWQQQLIDVGGDNVLPGRIYCDSFVDGSPNPVNGFAATYKALTLGVPGLATDPTLSSGGGSGHNYIYAFHYNYTFTDFLGTVFEEKGLVTEVAITDVDIPDGHAITVNSIPVLANTSSTNYDVAVIKVFIYRTQDNGSTFNKVGEVTNGTTTFVDSMSDATAISNLELYTDGDILEYNQPPVGARYVAQVNDFFWYATDRFITHSIQGAPGAAPSDYYQFQAQKITGLSSLIGFPILFCDRSVYRVQGNFDEQGNNGFDLLEISKTAGCKSNRSIVAVPGGLVWAGNGGFFFTDGYQVTRIVKQLPERYPVWAGANIVGTYDPDRNMVFWTVTSTLASNYTDLIAVLHLNFGQSERTPITTWRSEKFAVTTLGYSDSLDVDTRFRSKLLAMDYRGFVLSFDENYYTDPNLDPYLFTNDFKKSTVIYRLESAALDFGDDSIRKYCTELTCELATDTNTSLRFLTRRENGGCWSKLSEVRSDLPGQTGCILWGVSEYKWADPTDPYLHSWNDQPVTEAKRGFPLNFLRSNRRQIAITNSMTQIAKSDDLGVADVVASEKTITLQDPTKAFPADCEEYRISFVDDTYAQQWVIKTRNSDTQVTLWDPNGELTDLTGTAWQMKGYRKFERPHILSYSIFFDEGEITQQPQRGNAQNGLINA